MRDTDIGREAGFAVAGIENMSSVVLDNVMLELPA
jgi:hypothetical protein